MRPRWWTLKQGRCVRAPDAGESDKYSLTLFVSGASDSSAHAIAQLVELCDGNLAGRHKLAIVDVNQEPVTAGQHKILATPSLVKDHPPPARMLVGDMSDHATILRGLDIPVAATLVDEGAAGQAVG